MAYITDVHHFPGYKRCFLSNGTCEDISTVYPTEGLVLRRGPTTRELTNIEMGARQDLEVYNLQNRVLVKLLNGADMLMTLGDMLVDVAGSGGPVSTKKARDVQGGIQDLRDGINRLLNPE
ncbi:hypothetical protein E8E12_007003 [Didymella heteroderae]|uniref:Uncharacterized protein n=1 Tax=Didymella heteroderae TaxID=1769908 RepID=A0A9P4WRY3_9PLEO|nr:hypothetical protein E8E12_007003 [Didymella heteroderae]